MSKGEHPIEKILVKDKLFWEFHPLFVKFLELTYPHERVHLLS